MGAGLRRAKAFAEASRQKPIRMASGSGLLAHIEAAEQQAHRDGFHVTAHALNRAKNACGWEIAGDVERAGQAARDERS